MTLAALILGIVLSTAAFAVGYGLAGWTVIQPWLIGFGLAWLLAIRCRWNWFSSLGLILAVLAASIGFWFEFHAGWMIAGAVLALFAWDLTDFRARLRFLALDDDRRGMEQRHLLRVTFVVLTGLLLVTLSLLVRVQVTFEWAAFLVLVILLGLAQLVAWFARR